MSRVKKTLREFRARLMWDFASPGFSPPDTNFRRIALIRPGTIKLVPAARDIFSRWSVVARREIIEERWSRLVSSFRFALAQQ